MATLHAQLEDVIARLVSAIKEVAAISHFDEVDPKPRPPASAESIERYEQFLGQRLPDSYRAFLELHDGYDFLAYPGHMLSIREVMPGSPVYARIIEWKKMTTDYGGGEVLDGIVIAPLGEPNDWVYLDASRPSGSGELTVVAHYPDDSHEFQDLLEFFESRIRYCAVAIDVARETDGGKSSGL